MLGTHRTGVLLAFILAAINIHLLVAPYGYDLGNPPPEGTEIKALPSKSQALHRRLPFKRRQRRPRVRPPGSGPPTSATEWAAPKDITKTD